MTFAHLVKKYLPVVARVLMGLLFLMTGLNGFLNFLPMPANLPAGLVAFSIAMLNTGYLFQLAMGVQLIVAVMLLLNRYVPLALTLIAPIIVNIICIHWFLDRSGLPMAGFVLVLELYLAWVYRKSFKPMLMAKVTPENQ